MFWNIYSKRVLYSLRSKDTLVWTWIFPIMLATLFSVTLSAVDTAGRLCEIPLGVIDNAAYRREVSFQSALESVSGENGNRLFEIKLLPDVDEADMLLESKEIDGYILMDDAPLFIVGGDGLNQTIARSFLDQYLQTKNVVGTLISKFPEAAGDLPVLLDFVDYAEEISLSGNPPTAKINFFYALLAMVCMYGGFQGLTTISLMQANLSPLGARRTMSPSGRFRLMVYDLLGGITVHFSCLSFTLVYVIFILKADFGPKLGFVFLTCFLGSIFGVAFGAMVSVTSKLKEQAKVAILICATMVCCFLSGLMVSGINYTVAQKFPAVAWLNPAARITDAFYCLYYYDNYGKYFLNIGIVLVMAAAMFTITAFFARRQRYESI